MHPNEEMTGRREFLRTQGRRLLLGGLTATGAWLGWRSFNQQAGDSACVAPGVCAGCRLAQNCGLPKAIQHRQERARG